LQWRLKWENIIKKRKMSFAFEETPRISLSCKLVPVQYWEYEYGLFQGVCSKTGIFNRIGLGVQTKKPSIGGVWIFSGTKSMNTNFKII